VDAKARELRERSRDAPDDLSREFFDGQAKHYDALKADLEAMRTALEGIEAKAREICRS
jgi:hypothetical protein